MAIAIRAFNVEAYLTIAGQALVDALQAALPRESDATSALRESIRFTIQPFGLAYHFDLHLADYYKWVDEGRKAGKMPPVAKLIKWIADKKFIFQDNKLARARNDRKSKLSRVSDNLKLTTKLAWAIAKKISKEGTQGTNFYTPVVKLWQENLKRELPKAYGRDILITIKEAA